MRRGLVLLVVGLWLLVGTAHAEDFRSNEREWSEQQITNPCNGETVTVQGWERDQAYNRERNGITHSDHRIRFEGTGTGDQGNSYSYSSLYRATFKGETEGPNFTRTETFASSLHSPTAPDWRYESVVRETSPPYQQESVRFINECSG